MQTATRRYLVAALLLIVGIVGAHGIRRSRAVDAGYMPTFEELPKRIGNYVFEEGEVSDTAIAFLNPDAMKVFGYRAEYTNPQYVDVSLIYGKDWRPIHSPLHCLAAAGWSIGSQQEVMVPAANMPHDGDIVAKRLGAVKRGRELQVLYALAYPGGTTASWVTFAYRVATGKAGVGGMIIMVRALVENGDRQAAQDELARVLAEIYSPAVSFWYTGEPPGQ